MPPVVPPIASVVPLVTPPVAQPVTQVSGPPAPQLVWMSQEDWQTVVTRRELKAEDKVERPRKAPTARRGLHTDERAAAAGFDVDNYSAQAVRRAERAQEDPERALLAREAEARRKRVRRIEEGKEDREAHCVSSRARAIVTRSPSRRLPMACERLPPMARRAAQRQQARISASSCSPSISDSWTHGTMTSRTKRFKR